MDDECDGHAERLGEDRPDIVAGDHLEHGDDGGDNRDDRDHQNREKPFIREEMLGSNEISRSSRIPGCETVGVSERLQHFLFGGLGLRALG